MYVIDQVGGDVFNDVDTRSALSDNSLKQDAL